MAVTDPLPLVPAINTLRYVVCGSPSAAQSVRMFANPNFIPNVSSERRYCRGSMKVVWARDFGVLASGRRGRRPRVWNETTARPADREPHRLFRSGADP